MRNPSLAKLGRMLPERPLAGALTRDSRLASGFSQLLSAASLQTVPFSLVGHLSIGKTKIRFKEKCHGFGSIDIFDGTRIMVA
jgi:hypothetical protein